VAGSTGAREPLCLSQLGRAIFAEGPRCSATQQGAPGGLGVQRRELLGGCCCSRGVTAHQQRLCLHPQDVGHQGWGGIGRQGRQRARGVTRHQLDFGPLQGESGIVGVLAQPSSHRGSSGAGPAGGEVDLAQADEVARRGRLDVHGALQERGALQGLAVDALDLGEAQEVLLVARRGLHQTHGPLQEGRRGVHLTRRREHVRDAQDDVHPLLVDRLVAEQQDIAAEDLALGDDRARGGGGQIDPALGEGR